MRLLLHEPKLFGEDLSKDELCDLVVKVVVKWFHEGYHSWRRLFGREKLGYHSESIVFAFDILS